MFAVVRTGGKQYKVAEGDRITVEKLDAEQGGTVQLDDVIMVAGEKKRHIGHEANKNAKVEAEVVEHGRGDKITVFKKKRRKGYRRKHGHRQHQTRLKITKINAAS
jgi:large subunit ribosomal protein L21